VNVPFHPTENYPEYRGRGSTPGIGFTEKYGKPSRCSVSTRKTSEHRPGIPSRGSCSRNDRICKAEYGPALSPGTQGHLLRHHPRLHTSSDHRLHMHRAGRKRPIIIGDSQVIFGRFDKAYEISQIESLLECTGRNLHSDRMFDLRIVRGARSWMYGKWARKRVEQDPGDTRWWTSGAELF